MIKHTHIHRHFRLSLESEARLCHTTFGNSPDIPASNKNQNEWTDTSKDLYTNYVPLGMRNGIESVIQHTKAGAGSLQDTLRSVGAFFHHLPFFGQYFEGLKFSDVQSYKNLTDQAQWVEAFNDFNDLKNPAVVPSGVMNVTPKMFLASLHPSERQKIYLSFIDNVIPEDVQVNNTLPSPRNFRTSADRFAAMTTQEHLLVTDSLKGIFDQTDLNKLNPLAKTVAKQSLAAKYGPELALSGLPLKSLKDDYYDALSGERFVGLRSARTSTAQLEESVYAPPTLRAALKLGVIRNEHLSSLSTGFERTQFRESTVRGTVRKNLDDLTGIVKTDIKRDALGVQQIFNNMSGLEKVILLGGALWALKSSMGKGLAGAAAFMYFGMKLGLKDPDPIATASGWLGNLANLNGRIKNESMPGGFTDPRHRVGPMMAFLKDYDPEGFDRLEMQTTGFAMVGDVRMSDIANNMNVPGEPYEAEQSIQMSLNVPGMQKVMEGVRKKNKWKSNTDRFFQDPSSVRELTGGFGYVLFKLASQNPTNFEYASQFNEAMRKLPAALSIADIPLLVDKFVNPTMRAAAEQANMLYMKLVNLGQGIAESDQRPFGDVIASITPKPTFSPRYKIRDNQIIYPRVDAAAARPGPGADDRKPTGPDDTTPGGPDDSKPEGPDDRGDPGPDDTKPSGPDSGTGGGPDDSKPAGPDASRPGGPDTSRPGGPDKSRPGAPDSSKPSGPDALKPGKPDDSKPKGADDAGSGGPNVSRPEGPDTSKPGKPVSTKPGGPDSSAGEPDSSRPEGPEEKSEKSDNSRPSGPEDSKGSPDSTKPKGPGEKPSGSDDVKPGGAKENPSGPNSKKPSGADLTNESGDKKVEKTIEDVINDIPDGTSILGKELEFVVNKKPMTVKFTEDAILFNTTPYVLKIDAAFKMRDAKFKSVIVGKDEDGKKALNLDAEVDVGGDTGDLKMVEIKKIVSAISTTGSYEGALGKKKRKFTINRL